MTCTTTSHNNYYFFVIIIIIIIIIIITIVIIIHFISVDLPNVINGQIILSLCALNPLHDVVTRLVGVGER